MVNFVDKKGERIEFVNRFASVWNFVNKNKQKKEKMIYKENNKDK